MTDSRLPGVSSADAAPDGSVRIVGVLDGSPLEPLPSDAILDGFEGKMAEVRLAATAEGLVVLVGLGEEVDVDGLRRAAGAAGRATPVGRPASTSLHLVDVDGATDAVVTGYLLGSYRFTDYRSTEQPGPGDLTLVGEVDDDELERARTVAGATVRARDWTNRPSADKAPEALATEMADVLRSAGVEADVWGESEIADEELGCLLAVAAGSDRPPRMVIGHRPGSPNLALVGKGIVFDSGGLSIKTAEYMETMKRDMAGAAAVAAAAAAIAQVTPDVGLSVYLPLTDNMSGGSAMKPGDVLKARNGKTIEVLNTDAEGRLVLADALALAAEREPDLIVDVATLTGAARVALGDHIAAVFANADEPRDQVLAAGERAGERLWPMPLPEDYARLVSSSVADMKNTGGRYGGAIAAALLLAEFVGDIPWAHIDIAGPSWYTEDGPLGPKGASGFGVGTLVALAEGMHRP
ncbi:MAG TPA: leucyl aminopeptidase [Acidimicrobiia bacterium]|nr:leucyl aminopeptidase [Acidimicrobiia bacterium]